MKDLIETLEEYANGFTNVIAPPEEDVKELLKHIYNQEQEIERLNKELEGKNKVIDAMIDNEEEYCIEINNLKDRIDKAIEYIKNNQWYSVDYGDNILDAKEILDILKGENKQ